MNPIHAIRQRLGMTQSELAEAMEMSQGNVSFYENGQTVPPAAASRLIAVASERGLRISFDHVYGHAQLPAPPRGRARERACTR